MSAMLRKLLGPYLDQADEDGGDLGGGGSGATENDGDAGKGDDAGTEGGDKDERPVSEIMLAGIEAGLKGEAPIPPDGDDKGKAATEAAAAAAAKGTPPADDKAKTAAKAGDPPVDDKAKPAAKTAKDFEIPPEQAKLLKAETRERFQGLIEHTKAVEAQFAKVKTDYEAVVQHRDGFAAVLKECGINGHEDMMPLLEYQRNMTSGNFQAVYDQLKPIMDKVCQHLGIAYDGVDPLAGHDDLKSDVEDGKITRDRALELVRTRNEASLRERSQQEQQQTQQQQQARRQAEERAIADIERWTQGLAKSDVDYSKKEAKILAKVQNVIANYAPEQWLPTLTMLYGEIKVDAPTQQSSQQTPLRSGGGKNPAPQHSNMLDAISAGLGYK